MKRTSASLAMGSLLSLGLLGCAEKSSTTKETIVTTPEGSTTVTDEKEVKQTGENPLPDN
jgi:hypothetical protein